MDAYIKNWLLDGDPAIHWQTLRALRILKMGGRSLLI